MIGVAIGGPTTDDALRAMSAIADRADIVELRLDLFKDEPNLARLLTGRPLPIVVTCRAAIEGGQFTGTEKRRLEILRQAAACGADYIDVEQFAFPELGDISPSLAIVSSHEYKSMPWNLAERWAEIRDLGADVVKVAGMATGIADVLKVLDVLAQADETTIAMAMGSAGVATRIVALRYEQCLLTYASLDGDAGTAPGQISLTQMRDLYRSNTIDSETVFFGVVAPTPDAALIATYNAELVRRGVNGVCVPLPSDNPHGSELRRLADHGFRAFHVDAPAQARFKTTLDEYHAVTKGHETVNSVRIIEGFVFGEYASSPSEQVDLWLSSI